MGLSNSQLQCLQAVSTKKIMLVPPDMDDICEYLKSEGYIDMITVLTIDKSKDYPTNELHANGANIIIQITQKGEAYLAERTTTRKNINTTNLIAAIAIISSFIMSLLGLILK